MADGAIGAAASGALREAAADLEVGAADTAPSPALRRRRQAARTSTWAVVLLLASLGLGFATFLVCYVADSDKPGQVGFWLVVAAAMAGGVAALASIGLRLKAGAGFSFGMMFVVMASGFMSLVGALFAMLSTSGFSRGRQLRSWGRVLLPPVEPGIAWTTPEPGASAAGHVDVDDADLRAALAAQWRENGRTEHASVAAFARLTLDLMALGAPPELVASSNRDALDEIRHTELCFSLARELDGEAEGPGAFPAAQTARTLPPTRTLALAALAVDSLVDGALHEGISARVVARLAKRCEVPRIRAMLKEIAADEGRHAAHGWDVVEFCLAEGGAPVAHALAGAAAKLPRELVTPMSVDAASGAWETFGLPGRALEAEELAATRASLVKRLDRLLAPFVARAAA